MNLNESSSEEFIKTVLHERFLYLWRLQLLGYQVNHNEIKELEAEFYQDIPELNYEGIRELYQRDIDELQLILSINDQEPNEYQTAIKATFFKLNHTILKMLPDKNHGRPHFHIQYKNEYCASYAIDNFERLVGSVPSKYEDPILKWAFSHKKSLLLSWNKMKSGGNVQFLVLEATEA
jgi:hypothetical protein